MTLTPDDSPPLSEVRRAAETRGWNEAIEAAAKVALNEGDRLRQAHDGHSGLAVVADDIWAEINALARKQP